MRAATVPPAAPQSTPAPAAPSPRATPATLVRSDFSVAGELEQGGWIRGRVPSGTVSARLGDEPVRFDAIGHFFAGFDRNAPESETLFATLSNGQTITRTLAIAPRQWRIERVNVPMRKGGPSAAFMKIRRPELAAINAARAEQTDADGWKQKFIWPVKGRISGLFGSQRIYQGVPGAYHSGIDIATGESGTPYVAPADGVVVLASQKPFSLEGNLLIIDHGMGLNSAFLHSSKIVVHQGEHVKQGQLLGYIGSTGRATGPHLHWSLKWEDSRLDPLLFTGPMP
nr:M23 family metallopeptidase [Qipengyuania algicida]